jgi:hypothetical protein
LNSRAALDAPKLAGRPPIVAQAASATTSLPTVLLIPLTSQLDALRFPGTVLIERDATNGLRQNVRRWILPLLEPLLSSLSPTKEGRQHLLPE